MQQRLENQQNIIHTVSIELSTNISVH